MSNYVEIKFLDLDMPITLSGEQLKNVRIDEVIDPTSATLPISTASFTACNVGSGVDLFKKGVQFQIFYKNSLRVIMYITNVRKNQNNEWEVEGEDSISRLDKQYFTGDIYGRSKDAGEIASAISLSAGVDVHYPGDPVLVQGYLPYTTCREALQYLANSIDGFAVVERTQITIYNSSYVGNTQIIPLSRIMSLSQEPGEIYGVVEIQSRAYIDIYDPDATDSSLGDYLTLYSAREEGAGSDILVKFERPMCHLILSVGDIENSTATYARISPSRFSILRGLPYAATIISDRYEDSNQSQGKVIIENPLYNVGLQSVTAQNIYEYYAKNITKARIVEGKHTEEIDGEIVEVDDTPVNIGDVVTLQTGERFGDITGRIVRQTYNLNGGIIVKDVEIR